MNYLKIVFVSCLICFLVGCATPKDSVIQQIDNYRGAVLREASFDTSEWALRQTCRKVVSQKYETMGESREGIFGRNEDISILFPSLSYKEEVLVEVFEFSNKAALSISLKTYSYRKSPKTAEYKWEQDQYDTFDGTTKNKDNATIKELRMEIYKALYGEIQLPLDLQRKVEQHNSQQTKEGKKIVKGLDY